MSAGNNGRFDSMRATVPVRPRETWDTLPVQPPSGVWQKRGARFYPSLLVFIILVAITAFARQLPGSTQAFYVFAGIAIVHAVSFVLIGIRGSVLERREREHGYTTWVRSD